MLRRETWGNRFGQYVHAYWKLSAGWWVFLVQFTVWDSRVREKERERSKRKTERHRQTGRQTNRQNEKDTVTFHLQRETKKQRETQTPNRDGGAG